MVRYLILLFSSSFLHGAGIDSGGNKSTVGTLTNHGSIGAIVCSGTSTTGYLRSHAGLIEVLYAVPTSEADDSDNDNMPDAWEEENGLVVGFDDAGSDKDKDGISNLMEFLAGSDPNDSSSFFKPSFTQQQGIYSLTVQSQLNRNYRFWVSVDLETWVDWADDSGTGESLTFTFDPSSSEVLTEFTTEQLHNCFFRIELSLEQ